MLLMFEKFDYYFVNLIVELAGSKLSIHGRSQLYKSCFSLKRASCVIQSLPREFSDARGFFVVWYCLEKGLTMARVNVEEICLAGFGLSKLTKLLGWDEARVMGHLVFLWYQSQKEQFMEASVVQIADWTRIYDNQETLNFIKCALQCKFLKPGSEDGLYKIAGNEDQLGWIEGQRESGRRGGLKTQEIRKSLKNSASVQPQIKQALSEPSNNSSEPSNNSSEPSNNSSDPLGLLKRNEGFEAQFNSIQFNSKQYTPPPPPPLTPPLTPPHMRRVDRSYPEETFFERGEREKVLEFLKHYNDICGKKTVAVRTDLVRVNGKRYDLIKQTLEAFPDLEHWKEVFTKTASRRFLSGKNNTNWVAEIEWIIENHAQIIERKSVSGPIRLTEEGVEG